MKIHYIIVALLCLSCNAYGEGDAQPLLKIQYNSSDLLVITIEANKLECTWHTYRKDLDAMRADLESFDKHMSSISLTPSESSELLRWARKAIETKVTDDQNRSRRGYSTILSVAIDGKTHSPNHETIKAFKKIISNIIKDRRKEGFQKG